MTSLFGLPILIGIDESKTPDEARAAMETANTEFQKANDKYEQAKNAAGSICVRAVEVYLYDQPLGHTAEDTIVSDLSLSADQPCGTSLRKSGNMCAPYAKMT